jgi:cytochrome c oxidase cbb3-type subunit I/II
MEDHFTLQECWCWYNIIRTVSANNAIEDIAVEASSSKISSSRIKGEKFHPWLESV